MAKEETRFSTVDLYYSVAPVFFSRDRVGSLSLYFFSLNRHNV